MRGDKKHRLKNGGGGGDKAAGFNLVHHIPCCLVGRLCSLCLLYLAYCYYYYWIDYHRWMQLIGVRKGVQTGGVLLQVGFLEKLAKEVDHCKVVAELEVGELLHEDSLVEDGEHSMADAEEKLDELNVGHPLLQRVHKAKGGVQVVRVHEQVNNGVKEGTKVGGATGLAQLEEEAPDEEDGGVVVHVQEGELSEVLLQDHDPRVDEVKELAGVVHKHEPLNLLGEGRVQTKGVLEREPIGEEAPGHVSTEDDLRQVVHLGEGLKLVLLLALHELLQHRKAQEIGNRRASHEGPGHIRVIAFKKEQSHGL